MRRWSDVLRRVRELHLDRAHQFLGVTDWWAVARDASGGDEAVAADVLELLDQCAPDPACLRSGQEWLLREHTPPEHRFVAAGLVFDFWAQGGVYLSDDSPEVRWYGGPVFHRYDRPASEVAAVIGKACVLADLKAASTVPVRFAQQSSPPVPARPLPPPVRRDAGYVQEPEEDDRP